MCPFRGGSDGGGVRSVFERVVFRVDLTVGDGIHFALNGDERIAESIQLGLGFAFGGFDHERARHGERHGRRVVAIIDQTLGNVFNFDAFLFPRAKLEDAFVGDEIFGSLVEDGETILQTLGDVVGVEDRNLCRTSEAVWAHHANIHPRDDQDARRTERGSRNRTAMLIAES